MVWHVLQVVVLQRHQEVDEHVAGNLELLRQVAFLER